MLRAILGLAWRPARIVEVDWRARRRRQFEQMSAANLRLAKGFKACML